VTTSNEPSERQRLGAARAWSHVRESALARVRRGGQHLLGQIDRDDLARATGQRQRGVARAAADVEHALVAAQRRALDHGVERRAARMHRRYRIVAGRGAELPLNHRREIRAHGCLQMTIDLG
jgi:hypothetical protein